MSGRASKLDLRVLGELKELGFVGAPDDDRDKAGATVALFHFVERLNALEISGQQRDEVTVDLEVLRRLEGQDAQRHGDAERNKRGAEAHPAAMPRSSPFFRLLAEIFSSILKLLAHY